MAHWQGTGLACIRPWAPTTVLKGQGKPGGTGRKRHGSKLFVCGYLKLMRSQGRNIKGYN